MIELQQLRELANRVEDRQADLDAARENLHDAICMALSKGVDAASVAKWSGVSKPYVYQIRSNSKRSSAHGKAKLS
ncbi:hypothetical protein [Glutamicibacter endophyticus]|uniref:hypothetical protein n=1 Tax=Glutamicibacter endophyticus TaxID=1522174 RepID=UPI003AEFED39